MSTLTQVREGQSPLVRLGNYFFRARNYLTPLVMVGLFATFRPRYPGGSESMDRWLDLVGLLVILTGQALRVAVIGYAYIIRGGKDKQVYAEELVTGGFFAHCRNPLYLGNLLVFAGLFLIFHNLWVYALGMPFYLLFYAAIVAAEEDYLRAKFGEEYEAYCRRVPRWIPRFRGLRRTVEGMVFHWRRVIVKEHSSTYSWIVAVLLLLAYETLIHFSYRERAGYLNTLAVVFLVATAGWAMVRYLKRSKRLQAD